MKTRVALPLIIALTAFLSWSCEDLILDAELPKAPPPTVHQSRLATILDSLRYALDLPALAGAVVTDTGVVDAQAVGCRRYGGAANVTNSDQFHLGSCTKAFTAVLLGTIVDDGKVDWNTTLPEIFPEYSGSMREEYRSVTLRDILSHSSGLLRDVTFSPKPGTPTEQRMETVAWALQQQPAVRKGVYSYSNVGYSVAGAIAEKLTGRSYEDLLAERVLTPLGITSAGFGPMGTPGLEDEPLQHNDSHSPLEPTPDADNPPTYDPSGRLHMSIGDWARFIHWVLLAASGQQALLRDETARMLTTGIVTVDTWSSYAMGWQVYNYADWSGGRMLTHGGSNGFNYALADIAPSRHFAIVLATNQGPGTSANPLNPPQWRLRDFYLNGK